MPAVQTPAGTWITTTSLIDLWIIAACQVRWAKQRGSTPVPPLDETDE